MHDCDRPAGRRDPSAAPVAAPADSTARGTSATRQTSTTSGVPARRSTATGLLILAYLAFASLGLPDGLLGVGWPSIAADFAVPTEAVGFLLTAAVVGYLSSSVLAGFTVARLGVGRLLAGSTALATLALAGYTAAPGLGPMVACALLLGLGSGAIDSGLNAYAAGAFGPRHMNWMHAGFGLGVAFGPLIMTAVLGAGLAWRWGYGIVGGAELLLAAAFAMTIRAWGDRRGAGPAAAGPRPPVPGTASADPVAPAGPDDQAGGDGSPIRVRDTLVLPAAWLGALALAVYVAIEVAAGLWAFLLLTEGRGLGAAAAGICVSIYWGSLFFGRVVQGFVAERVGTAPVLWTSLVAMAVGAGLVALPGPGWLAVIGFAVIGLGAAPVFPLLTLTTAERVGAAHADRVIGLQVGASGLGGAVVPAGIGVLIGRFGVEVLGPALLSASLVLLLLYAVSLRARRA